VEPVSTTGLISWFGGPGDPTDSGHTASGGTTATPGIAVYNHATLGGWWLLKAPNGSVGIVQQTDVGPAPSTGRKFDFTYSLLPLFGYTTKNFPTGSQATGIYLGKTLSDIAKSLPAGMRAIGPDAQQQAALMQSVDAGSVMRGHSIVVNPGGKGGQTNDPQGTASGSEAVASNILPSPNLSGLDAIGNFFNKLTNPEVWLRALEVIAGVILLAMGLMSLSGRTTTPVTVVQGAARAGRKAATTAAKAAA